MKEAVGVVKKVCGSIVIAGALLALVIPASIAVRAYVLLGAMVIAGAVGIGILIRKNREDRARMEEDLAALAESVRNKEQK
jgi:hypothetical protein